MFAELEGGPPHTDGTEPLGLRPKKVHLRMFLQEIFSEATPQAIISEPLDCVTCQSLSTHQGTRKSLPSPYQLSLRCPFYFASRLPFWTHLPLSLRGPTAHSGDLFGSPSDTVSQSGASVCIGFLPARLFSALSWTNSYFCNSAILWTWKSPSHAHPSSSP